MFYFQQILWHRVKPIHVYGVQTLVDFRFGALNYSRSREAELQRANGHGGAQSHVACQCVRSPHYRSHLSLRAGLCKPVAYQLTEVRFHTMQSEGRFFVFDLLILSHYPTHKAIRKIKC